MKRESSMAVREHSREGKGASKVKKRKSGYIMPLQKKTENIPFNNYQEHQAKFRSLHSFKELAPSRISQKLKIIGKCIQKSFNKRQMETFSKLCREIEKQFSIRITLDDHQSQGNTGKIKQLKAYLARIIQKEEELIKQWTLQLVQSPHSTNNNSGVFSNDLIARQMSPKHNFNSFALLQKKQTQYEFNLKNLQDTISKKDHVIKGLFEKMEKMAGQQERHSTFRKCMETITSKIDPLQSKVCLIQQIQQKLSSQRMKSNDLAHLNNALKDENSSLCRQINRVQQEKQRLEKKYRDLNEEFQELVGQKVQLQILNTKKERQTQHIVCSYSNLLSNSRQKLQEIVREELNFMKTQHQYEKSSIVQQMNLCWSVLQSQVQELIKVIEITMEEKMQRLSQKCFNLERKFKNSEIQCQKLRNSHSNQEEEAQKMKMREENKKMKMKLENRIIFVQIQQTQPKLQINSFPIYSSDVLGLKRTQQTQTNSVITRMTLNLTQNIEVEPTNKEVDSVVVQTQANCIEIGIETDTIDSVDKQTETLTPILHVCTEAISQNLVFTCSSQSQTQQVKLSFNQVFEFRYIPEIQFFEQGNQTEQLDPLCFPIVEDPEQQTFLQKSEQSQNENNEQNEEMIIKMLQQAQECLLVPQIQVLKMEILEYQEEIQKMRLKMRQLEKEKEEENVFNFRL